MAPGIHGAMPRTETMPGPFDIFHAPAVADGVFYFGSGDHNVYALNAETSPEMEVRDGQRRARVARGGE